jgi:hypothetical protein
MSWLFVILCLAVAAGRIHSQYLDSQQARWTMPEGNAGSPAHR